MKDLTNLVNSIAWSFCRTTGIDFKELQAEATLACLESLQDFDPSKGAKESTYCYTRIVNHLRFFIKKEKPYSNMISIDSLVDMEESESPINILPVEEQQDFWFEIKDRFSENAERLVNLVLSNQIELEGSSKAMRGQVRKAAYASGVTQVAFYEGVREIKQVLGVQMATNGY